MQRPSLQARLKYALIRNPILANRVLGALGARGLERIARRAAMRAARRAYTRVPFYRALYDRQGLDATRMQRLTWADFTRLPIIGKVDMLGARDRDLVDATQPNPSAVSLIGRSSGSTGRPTIWQAGWDELFITRAACMSWLREIRADRERAAVLLLTAVEGGDVSGNMPLRAMYSVKEQTQWPFEVFATGEDPATVASILRWLVEQEYRGLMMITFPGTMERLLDYLAAAAAADPAAAMRWEQFAHKKIMLAGQLVVAQLRRRVDEEMCLDPKDLSANMVAYASSDAGIAMAATTPFTRWLERTLEAHPELYEKLGIPEEQRAKPILQFNPPTGTYIESDEDGQMLLTTWKYRPLIRYRSNDLGLLWQAGDLRRLLDSAVRGWRQDFERHGYGRGYVPQVGAIGMVLGRADEVRIVNGANVAPELLREALAAADLLPQLHHFKHNTDDAHPNDYFVYLELEDVRDLAERDVLAAAWTPQLLDTLVHLPAASDLYAAHRTNPINLQLFVRSRGEDEFAGDDDRPKRSYVPRPAAKSVVAHA